MGVPNVCRIRHPADLNSHYTNRSSAKRPPISSTRAKSMRRSMAAENGNKAVSVIRFRLMCIHAINLVPAAGSVVGLTFTAVQPSEGLLIYKRVFRQIFCQKIFKFIGLFSAVQLGDCKCHLSGSRWTAEMVESWN